MELIYSTESPKIKNLILNQSYVTEEETSEHYFIKNQAGIVIPYSKKYFTVRPIVVPYVPRVIIGTFDTSSADNNYLGRINIRIPVIGRTQDFKIYSSDISCGVKFIQNISGVMEILRNAFAEESITNLSIMLSEILLAVRTVLRTTFLIFSNNESNSDILNGALDILSEQDLIVKTPWLINANSNNNIIIFILKTVFVEGEDDDGNEVCKIADSNFEYHWINGDIFQS